MVINDRYRFVFVHVPKSGGSSLTRALRWLWGNNRRWVKRRTKHETLAELYERWPERQGMLDRWLKLRVQDYVVFGFVRNPWERMASLFRYLVEQRPRTEIDTVHSLPEFLDQAAAGVPWIRELHSLRPQVDFFRASAGGPIRADFVGRFEHLAEDFLTVTQSLGIRRLAIPHRNRSTNANRDYRHEFSDQMIEIVAELFREDIETFGYRFDQREPLRGAGPLRIAG